MGHVERIREIEWDIVRPLLARRAKILEIGGGSGFQANLMVRDGFEVVSLDTCPNRGPIQYFKVLLYDGVHLPFESETFDVVYSSNALEHVEELEGLFNEMSRVLRPRGSMVHLVPSSSWRFWTTLAHYPFLVKYAISLGRGVTMGTARTTISGTVKTKGWLHFFWRAVFSGPHGQDANALVELVSFSKWYWVRRFRRAGLHLVSVRDTFLFYTGYELMPGLPLWCRWTLGRILGGACHVFVLSKQARDGLE